MPGGDGRWIALMFGILEGSRASSTRAFLKGTLEILVVCLLQLLRPFQSDDFGTGVGKLLHPLLDIAELTFQHLRLGFHACELGTLTSKIFIALRSAYELQTRKFLLQGAFSDSQVPRFATVLILT